jgi:hypothetical protein
MVCPYGTEKNIETILMLWMNLQMFLSVALLFLLLRGSKSILQNSSLKLKGSLDSKAGSSMHYFIKARIYVVEKKSRIQS